MGLDKREKSWYPIRNYERKPERTNTLTLRRIVPLLIGALLLAALLLLHFTRVLDWNWARESQGDSQSPVVYVGAERVDTQPSELYVTVSLDDASFARLTKLNDRFIAQYPHIEVHLRNEAPGSLSFEDWLTAGKRGDAPDVMLLNNALVLPLAVQGYLKSVDALMTGDMLTDQLAGLLEPLLWYGYLWGVPADIDPYLLFWNKDMLAELGQQSPIPDVERLDETLKKMTDANEGEPAYFTNLSPGDLHQLLIWEAKFHQGEGKFIALKKAEETGGAPHLEWLNSQAEYVSGIPLSQPFKLSELLIDNRLLSAVMTWGAYTKLNKGVQEKLILDSEGLSYPWLNGSSFAISAGSKHDDDAIIWIEEMTGAANSDAAFGDAGKLPVRASLYGEQDQLAFRNGPMPPAWWYEALNAKQPEGENALADPLWPLRWQQWEAEWRLHSGDGELRIAEFLAAVTSKHHE